MIDIQLVENDSKEFEKLMHDDMQKAIKHFEGELIKIRTGRAHTSLVEDIQVSCYGGAPMSLKSVAVIAAPDVRLITIQPWDASTIPDIERAILESDVGITPASDGKIVRLSLPEMSSERRDELLKILGKKLEECKIAVRNVRKDFNNLVRDSKKDKTISENFANRLADVVDKITGKFIASADELAKKKEKEVTTF